MTVELFVLQEMNCCLLLTSYVLCIFLLCRMNMSNWLCWYLNVYILMCSLACYAGPCVCSPSCILCLYTYALPSYTVVPLLHQLSTCLLLFCLVMHHVAPLCMLVFLCVVLCLSAISILHCPCFCWFWSFVLMSICVLDLIGCFTFLVLSYLA